MCYNLMSREEMHSVLGAYVEAKSVPFPLLVQHMFQLCTKPHPDAEELCVNRSSLFQKELQACCREVCRRDLETPLETEQKNLLKKNFYTSSARCVGVKQFDAADQPATGQIMLTSPRRCFFFSSGSSCVSGFQSYLRKADGHFSGLYEHMGVKEGPDVHDFAAVTQRVKEQIEDNKNEVFDADLEVLQACVEGFHDCLQSFEDDSSEFEPIKFFLPRRGAEGGLEMEEVAKLVWMDIDCWKDRLCGPEIRHRLCHIPGKEIADTMLQSLSRAGLQPISVLVEEVVASEVAESDTRPGSLQEAVRLLFSSPLMLPAIKAILQGSRFASGCHPDLQQLAACLGFDVKSVPSKVEIWTYLRWKDGGIKLEGSEKKQLAILQSDNFLVSDDAFHHPDQFVTDLFAAFCRLPGLPCHFELPDVEKPLKELLKLVFSRGPEGIPEVLRDNKIESDLERTKCLGIGDLLPEHLHATLNPSMTVAFEDDEYVIAEVEGHFRVGRVAPWKQNLGGMPVQQPKHSLMRQYRVQLSKNGDCRILCLKDLYKLRGRSSQVSVSGHAFEGRLLQADPSMPTDGARSTGRDEEALLKEVKAQLREMATMNPEDYKRALRRLFLAWHPDKAGNTEFNKSVFCMLKDHEAWYRDGGGDDAWLDEESPAYTSEAPSSQAPRNYAANPSSQASWLDEFEKDLQRQRMASRSDNQQVQEETVQIVFHPEPQQWTSPRTVDESQALAFLAQAEYDLQATLHLKDTANSKGAPFFSLTVFHASQVVEKALKAAMLRTCGLAKGEFTGKEAHDLLAFHQNLKEADPETIPQRQAQVELPGTASDMGWLRHAYLASRYPNASPGRIPALAYHAADAERASQLAQQMVQWAKQLEDLPQPRTKPRDEAEDVPTEQEEAVVHLAAAPSPGPVLAIDDNTTQALPEPPTPPRPLKSTPAAPPLATSEKKKLAGERQRMLGGS